MSDDLCVLTVTNLGSYRLLVLQYINELGRLRPEALVDHGWVNFKVEQTTAEEWKRHFEKLGATVEIK